MALRKKKQGLVRVLIDKFMGDTLDPSRQTLAFSIGNPAKKQAESKDLSEHELGLRSDYLYTIVFAGHVSCGEHCEGHTLPKVPALVLGKLNQVLNHNLSFYNLKGAVRKWFQDIDMDLNSTIDTNELLAELMRMGLPEANADFFTQQFDGNSNGALEIEEFERAILHMLDTSIPGLCSMEIIALFSCFAQQAADSKVSLSNLKIDPLQFMTIAKDLSARSFEFTG